jgi:hypothetical protein
MSRSHVFQPARSNSVAQFHRNKHKSPIRKGACSAQGWSPLTLPKILKETKYIQPFANSSQQKLKAWLRPQAAETELIRLAQHKCEKLRETLKALADSADFIKLDRIAVQRVRSRH